MPRPHLRAFLLLGLAVTGLVTSGCKKQSQGPVRVIVIGEAPRLLDPAVRTLAPADAVLLQNVAQGLVSFDASGNIVGGLAERWTVSDDGLSYIFRLASTEWPDGRKVTARQVARLLKRALSAPNKNPVSDSLGAIEDIVAMTDRVIEIRLRAARPNLLSILAQPEMAVIRDGEGTGPFHIDEQRETDAEIRLVRARPSEDGEIAENDALLLAGKPAEEAVRLFAGGKADLVLGGSFTDLPYARRVKLPRGTLRFDPASGLFGLVPGRSTGPLGSRDARRLLTQAIDRDTFVAALGVPNLSSRATLLEAGLEGSPAPLAPAWTATAFADRLPLLQEQARTLFGTEALVVRVALPDGPGADLLLRLLQRDWGAIGLTVERARNAASADFRLMDLVAPSTSAAWFVRRFRCDAARVCDSAADTLMDQARETPSAPERNALLAQAAAIIEDNQLFIPLTAPVRWSLVSPRIRAFAGNRFARHSLTDLEQRLGSGD
jgi:peptide/nickel transport system substrate-binding protein